MPLEVEQSFNEDSNLLNWLYSEEDPRKSLRQAWDISAFNLNPPINRIRTYYGEKIAYYFSFLSTYTASLYLLAPFGIVVSVLNYLYDEEDIINVISNSTYCIVVAL